MGLLFRNRLSRIAIAVVALGGLMLSGCSGSSNSSTHNVQLTENVKEETVPISPKGRYSRPFDYEQSSTSDTKK